ncbi:hypothetical protein [Alkalihalophilus marmarensis]|uniref:Uncharacterized protein n=1 Tax=Alkalihalophilus marmarensis DSM 21297 TaxID=1188261 RepID=U6SQD8_9BACI|nr:hypothetical protein [Alkalihalophilus marmarensis]ERN52841.1 hypothetical protein A33I_14210 [Alkalihalophilus marmarensis DSM 21297]
MGRKRVTSKSKRLFELMDNLHIYKEDMEYHVIKSRSNRLDNVEKNAKEIEAIAIEMQKLVKEMRRA